MQNWIRLKSLPYKLQYQKCLEYYNDPLTIEFINENKNYYVASWVDVIDKLDRYLLFKSSWIDIQKLINCEVDYSSLLEMISKSSELFIIDSTNIINIEIVNIWKCEYKDIPLDYLPDDDYGFLNPNILIN